MSESTRLVTAEELERFPRDDRRYELVEGRLVRLSPVNFDHGRTVMRIGFLLSRHLEQRPVGVIGAEIGFVLASNPDTVRGPDIAFIRTSAYRRRASVGSSRARLTSLSRSCRQTIVPAKCVQKRRITWRVACISSS
jgi:Uma2 family endonuclease